jgi:hypothetical protein
VPLSALGVVEIVDRVQPSTDPVCVMTEPPVTQPHVAPRIATPVAPTPGPQPTVSL